MDRRKFLNALGGASGMLIASPLLAGGSKSKYFVNTELSSVMSGIWKFKIGKPEKITPQSTRRI